jgi:hypothetical protein
MVQNLPARGRKTEKNKQIAECNKTIISIIPGVFWVTVQNYCPTLSEMTKGTVALGLPASGNSSLGHPRYLGTIIWTVIQIPMG